MSKDIVYLGIDPGVSGGIAAVWPDNGLNTFKMPTTEVGLWQFFKLYSKETTQSEELQVFAILERQTPRPTFVFDHALKKVRPTILKSTCQLYGMYTMIKGMLIAAGIDFEEVLPKEWQKYLKVPPRKKGEKESQWKNRLKVIASEMYPNEKITLATSDAVLIAKYGKLTKEG